MNHLKVLNLALMFAFAACDDPDPGKQPAITDNNTYIGTLTVAQGTAGEFILDDVEVLLTLDEGGAGGDIEMFDVKFAQAMPLTLDMTIPDVAIALLLTGEYSISGEGIVPIAMGGPFRAYTITGLVGTATPTALSLNMLCGGIPVSYSGLLSVDISVE